MNVVVNLRSWTSEVTRIDRSSKWGNPYKVGNYGREEAIAKYKRWLWRQIKSGRITREELLELDDKALGCWCKPKPCHGDVLVKAIAWAKRR